MSAPPDQVAPEVVAATPEPGAGTEAQRDTGAPVSRARARGLARAVKRAGEPADREQDAPDFLSLPKARSPWSEDAPSPRCRIADARKGAETFSAVYWAFDAVPLALNVALKMTLGLATERPARFWGLFALVLTFIALAH